MQIYLFNSGFNVAAGVLAGILKGLAFRRDCWNIPAQNVVRAISSAGEHYLDMVGVTGSIPVSPTTGCDKINIPFLHLDFRPEATVWQWQITILDLIRHRCHNASD